MKILYAIQGTGNGHLSRAKEILPALVKRAQVHVLVSGTQAEISLKYPVLYRYKGLSFYFGKNGGIDYKKTIFNNNPFRLLKEILACPVREYDLVINDFEPISAWAAKLKGVKCVALSHQSALYTENVPQPTFSDWLGTFIIKNYAPSHVRFGFHFKKYNDNVYAPIIRREIREVKRSTKDFYTVYLPAYSDEKIIAVLSKIKGVKWKVFSKTAKAYYQKKNVYIKPIHSKKFVKSLANCSGVLCGAGFETPSEALFLRKKVMVIPMKKQYEQHFNAAALQELGVPVIPSLKKKYISAIENWMHSSQQINLSFPDETQYLVDHILYDYVLKEQHSEVPSI